MIYYKGHTYQLVETNKSYAQAEKAAEDAGGHLAIVESGAENDKIFKLAAKSDDLDSSVAPDGGGGRFVWLGGSDLAKEGDFRWADGSKVADGFDAWGSGPFGQEPDDFNGNQDGLAMGMSKWPFPSGGIGEPGEWNDVALSNRLFYVVEYDALVGTKGADTIEGSGADDVIEGRGGADRLTGGKGEDVFVYASASASANGKTADLIADFRSGSDHIDLAAIDANGRTSKDDDFRFLGEDGTPQRAGDLWFEARSGQTTVFGDVNGDGDADLVIKLGQAVDLKQGDFIL